MAKSKPAKSDILDELDALPAKPGWNNWVNLHPPETQAVLLEIKKRWQAGYYTDKGIQKTQLYDTLNARFALNVKLTSFRTWLGVCQKNQTSKK